MFIYTAEQIRSWDAFTLEHEPISSLALMERAASALAGYLLENYPLSGQRKWIFCGPGNNGGDGLVLARLLYQAGHAVKVMLPPKTASRSADFLHNLDLLEALPGKEIWMPSEKRKFPTISSGDLIIDGLFGSGLNRPISGSYAEDIDRINQLPNEVISIDLPSGLMADKTTVGPVIQADLVLSFECPKLAFFLPENASYVKKWEVLPIGLDPEFSPNPPSPYIMLTHDRVKQLLKPRHTFDHKGSYGHALLIAGSYGKLGAAILAAKACMRVGTGLLTVRIPSCGYTVFQTAFPEAMVQTEGEQWMTQFHDIDLAKFSAFGMGCGMGTHSETTTGLLRWITETEHPMVLDADALNMLAKAKLPLNALPKGVILTPHPGEFKRLFGTFTSDFDRLEFMRNLVQDLGVYIILKGAYTCIACPDGRLYFNSTGNPGMATAGSGDVLTGILTGLLAQGYTAEEACIVGVYLHGLAGDIGMGDIGEEALLASDIINYLGRAIQVLKS